jgi:hypothetical protein
METMTMALKAKMANKLKTDDNGYILGTITDIQFIDADESDYEREQFCFLIESEGTKKPIILKHWTGTIINGDNQSNNGDYNKLTRLLLQLGVIDEVSLKRAYKNGEEMMVDIEELKGLAVRFKTAKSAKLRGLSQLDPLTLELVKDPVTATATATK